MPPGVVSSACVEALIKAGAFDRLGGHRRQWLAVLPRAIKDGQAAAESRRRGQVDMFGMFEPDEPTNGNGHVNGNGNGKTAAALPDVPELPDAERLAEEKKVLGFYMTSHPLARHGAMLSALATHRVADLANIGDKGEVVLGGMISGVTVRNVQKSRSGLTRMAKLTFEDLTGNVPAMLWPEDFAKNEAMIKDDAICFVRGSLSRQRDPAELIINRIIPLERGAAELSRGVVVRLTKGVTQPTDLERLLRTIRNYPGNLDLYLEILGLERARRAVYKAGSSLKIRHDDKMINDLKVYLGDDNVRLLGQRGIAARSEPASTPLTAMPSAFDEAAVEEEEEE